MKLATSFSANGDRLPFSAIGYWPSAITPRFGPSRDISHDFVTFRQKSPHFATFDALPATSLKTLSFKLNQLTTNIYTNSKPRFLRCFTRFFRGPIAGKRSFSPDAYSSASFAPFATFARNSSSSANRVDTFRSNSYLLPVNTGSIARIYHSGFFLGAAHRLSSAACQSCSGRFQQKNCYVIWPIQF